MKKVKYTSRSICYRTNILFPRTNVLVGIGSIFNLAGNYFKFNTVQTEREADSQAIESDWGAIGQDLIKTVKVHPKKNF